MTAPAYGYSIKSRDSHGLDPSVYRIHVGVVRLDGKAMSAAELKKIAAALAPTMAADDDRPMSLPTKRPRATDKVASKGKAPSKTAAPAKPRKATKAPARKAARRPAKG